MSDFPSGSVWLVGAGPGDPELLTRKAERLIGLATVVFYDALVGDGIIELAAPAARLVHVGKRSGRHSKDQKTIDRLIVEAALAGERVVRLKGGDPYVFGRGYEELEACVEAGIPVTVVPGVTSPISVPAAAGIPVTHRGVTHEFVVVSGHLAPDHPDSLVDWPALGRLRGTLVLMMAVERIEQFAAALLDGGRAADTPATVIQEGTLRGQRVLRADLGTVAERVRAEAIRPPAIIVIGPTAGFSADPATI